MLQPFDISQLGIQKLEAFSKMVVSLCNLTNSSAIILCNPYVTLKDRQHKYSSWLGRSRVLSIFEEIWRRDISRKRAVKSLEHALQMHSYGINETNSRTARVLLIRLNTVLNESFAFTSPPSERFDILSCFEHNESTELIKQLKLEQQLTTLKMEEKEYHTFCNNSLSDLFLQQGVIEASETRRTLEQALSFFFAYVCAMEMGNSDPSWAQLSKKISSIDYQ